jgi:Tol biopolymer transport system component
MPPLTRALVIGFLAATVALPQLTVAEESPAAATVSELSEVVVSHTDEKGILQLYRMKEDGSDRRQLTHSERGCRMPACSPDGKKLIYVQQVDHDLSLWISDVNGKNARALFDECMNRIG